MAPAGGSGGPRRVTLREGRGRGWARRQMVPWPGCDAQMGSGGAAGLLQNRAWKSRGGGRAGCHCLGPAHVSLGNGPQRGWLQEDTNSQQPWGQNRRPLHPALGRGGRARVAPGLPPAAPGWARRPAQPCGRRDPAPRSEPSQRTSGSRASRCCSSQQGRPAVGQEQAESPHWLPASPQGAPAPADTPVPGQ